MFLLPTAYIFHSSLDILIDQPGVSRMQLYGKFLERCSKSNNKEENTVMFSQTEKA